VALLDGGATKGIVFLYRNNANNLGDNVATFPLTSLEDMTAYMEEKFSGTTYKAAAVPQDEFGPVVRYLITWTPYNPQIETIADCPMWVDPNGYTASVPFTR
jgi:hypothetical protein